MREEGWTVNEVQTITGISHRTLSDYLAGRREFLDHHLVALCDAFEVRPDDLISGQVE